MADHVALVARESEEFETTAQLVVVPHNRLSLERIAGVRQLKLYRNPLSRLKLGRENGGDTAFADIERASRNTAGQTRAQYSHIHWYRDWIAWNTATSSAEDRRRLSRRRLS